MRKFPIMGSERIKSIPWSLIAPHKKQARSNHDQSLETLASRGGLDPIEAMAAIDGKRLPFGVNLKKRVKADEDRLMSLVHEAVDDT